MHSNGLSLSTALKSFQRHLNVSVYSGFAQLVKGNSGQEASNFVHGATIQPSTSTSAEYSHVLQEMNVVRGLYLRPVENGMPY